MNNKQAQSRRQQRLAQQRAKEHVLRPKRAIKADLVFADPIKHLPEKLPDPWLFNSESLLRELDRCREMVLLIPTLLILQPILQSTHSGICARTFSIFCSFTVRVSVRLQTELRILTLNSKRRFRSKLRS